MAKGKQLLNKIWKLVYNGKKTDEEKLSLFDIVASLTV